MSTEKPNTKTFLIYLGKEVDWANPPHSYHAYIELLDYINACSNNQKPTPTHHYKKAIGSNPRAGIVAEIYVGTIDSDNSALNPQTGWTWLRDHNHLTLEQKLQIKTQALLNEHTIRDLKHARSARRSQYKDLFAQLDPIRNTLRGKNPRARTQLITQFVSYLLGELK